MRKRQDLHKYQSRMVTQIKTVRKCALFLDMGLGKTGTALTAVNDLLEDFAVNKVLILGTLRVANTVWHNEAKEWEHLQGLRFSICTGSAKERKAAFAKDADIYVTNFENLVWVIKNIGWQWDMLVIDESSAFKNHSSQRFKALRAVLGKIEYMVQLTGTPSPNGLHDLWSQMYLLDGGKRLGKTVTNFRNRFFDRAGFQGRKFVPRDRSDEKIHALIEDIAYHMSAEDYLEVPDKTNIAVRVTMPESAMEAYKEAERESVFQLENEEIEAVTAAALVNKLLQASNGAIYDEDKKWHEVHRAKIDALRELQESNPDENLFVAYNFKSDLERLQAAFPEAKTLSRSGEELEDWNKGKIKMLLAHPASAGHGLNAQRGGSVVVWFGLNWSLELYQQFNARVHRQGQTRPVRVFHIICEGTVDETVMAALTGKAKVQGDLLKALKLEIVK